MKIINVLMLLLANDRGNISLTGGDNSSDGSNDTSDGASDSESSSSEGSEESSSDDGNADTTGTEPLPEVDFPSGLEEEVKNDPSLKVFVQDGKLNYANLMKSYVHAQKKMGEKGVQLPGENSTEEDIAQFYNKIRPSELEKYELKNNLGEESTLDEEMFDGFRKIAHENGLSTKQAQTVLDWYNSSANDKQTSFKTEAEDVYNKEVEGLKSEWGDAFKREMNQAQRAIKEFADEDTLNYLKESGLDGNVKLIKLFNKVGKGLMEDKFDTESHGNFGTTKAEAQKKMDAIYGDPTHAYNKFDHPSHKHAVDEMNKLMEASLRE